MCTIRNSTPLHYWSIICCTRASSTGVKVTTELCSTIISTTLTYSPVAFILSVLGIYEPYYSINWLPSEKCTLKPSSLIYRFWGFDTTFWGRGGRTCTLLFAETGFPIEVADACFSCLFWKYSFESFPYCILQEPAIGPRTCCKSSRGKICFG